jgi:hypothetical protein
MTIYKKAFVYMIYLLENPDIRYVGSSMNERERDRWASHKKNYKTWLKNKEKSKCSIYPYIEQYGIENFKFQILKRYEVCDSNHIRAYEQLYINKMKCVNQLQTFQLMSRVKYLQQRKEYRQKNKEAVKEKGKQWRENNKEVVKEKKKEWYENNKESTKLHRQTKLRGYCYDCDKKYAKLKEHFKSNVHLAACLPVGL